MTRRWVCSLAAATLVLGIAGGMPAAQAAAPPPPPPPPPPGCTQPSYTTVTPKPRVLPRLNYGHLLHAADFAGTWLAQPLPAAFDTLNDPFNDATLSAAVTEQSTVLLRRQLQAPDWSGSQIGWRLKDAASAAAAFDKLRQRQLCQLTPGSLGRVRDERVDGQSASVVIESRGVGTTGGSGTFRRSTRVVVARSGELVTQLRLDIEATPSELRSVDAVEVGRLLRTATASRLVGRLPAHEIRLPVDAARTAPSLSTLLTAAELGSGWSRDPLNITSFSGGIDALGRSGRCISDVDIAASGVRLGLFHAPGDTKRSVASYETVFTLFPGYGVRYMALVRRNIALGCSGVQLAVPAGTVRTIGDDALLLTAAKGVSGQPPIIVVRRGDQVAVLGVFGSAQKNSVAWKLRVARAMAARLAG